MSPTTKLRKLQQKFPLEMEVNGSEHGKKSTNGDGIYYFCARPACFNAHFTPRGTLNALISALNCKLSALSYAQCAEFYFIHCHASHYSFSPEDLHRKLMASFNPGQLEVLKLLLNLTPEQRSLALEAVLKKDGAPLSPHLRRETTPSGYLTPVSDDSSITNSDDSKASGGKRGKDRKRIHSKNRVTRLASKICQEYLNSERVWKHLYGENNRVVEYKLDDVLDQIKVKLVVQEQKTLKTHRDLLKKALKKRMASGRRYRMKQKLVGKSVQQAHKATTIDLTVDDGNDADDDKDADECSETPTEPSIKSEPKEESSIQRSAQKKTRRQLAKDFADRMSERRNAKKARQQEKKSTADSVTKKKSQTKKSKQSKTQEEKSEENAPSTSGKNKSTPSKQNKSKRKQSSTAANVAKKKPRRTSRRTSQRKMSVSKDSTKDKDGAKDSFTMGMKVARDFDGEVFAGEITCVYPDDPTTCQITYTDGDTEDMDIDQVSYAMQLYLRECADE